MTGKSYLKPLKMIKEQMMLANVSFALKSRCFWHIHRATTGGGQILICTAGDRWYQQKGKQAVYLKEGSIVSIPTNVVHWHGAASDSWFSHIVLEIGGENVKMNFVMKLSQKSIRI